MAPRGGSRPGDSITEYELDREANLAKNRAVLAALSIPTLVKATRDTDEEPDETNASRRRRRGGASGSRGSGPSRRSNREKKTQVQSYKASGSDSDSDRDSDDGKKSEKVDEDFRSDDDDDESDDDEEDSDSDERDVKTLETETAGVIALDASDSDVPVPESNPTRKGKAKQNTSRGKKSSSEYALANPMAKTGALSETKKRKAVTSKTKHRKTSPEAVSSNPADDARDAILAFLAPAISVGVKRGKLKLENATFGINELRAVADAHGFNDWTDDELANMLTPEVTGKEGASMDEDVIAISGTDPFAADAERRAAVLLSANKVRINITDLTALAEKVGAKRRVT